MKLILILFTLMLASCSSTGDWIKDTFEPKSEMDDVQESHKPLEQQRLIPRPGYEGHLTNRVCLKWYGPKCEKDSVKKYSLKDEAIRKRLIRFKFACHISDKRYRICPNQEGFCRREGGTKECKKWGRTVFRRKKVCRKWGITKATEFFIPVDDYQLLLDGATECKKGY